MTITTKKLLVILTVSLGSLLLCGRGPSHAQSRPHPPKFSMGDRIVVSSTGEINVRSSAGSVRLGSQRKGAHGTVIGGPDYALLNGIGYWFWKIDYDTGVDGWAAQDYLSKFSGTPASDFFISNGGRKSVDPGNSVTNPITATRLSGTATPVSFSASGLPAEAIASFSQTSCTPTCQTTLTIATQASTPTGEYAVTVTGSDGNITQATSFKLAVGPAPVAPSTPSIKFSIGDRIVFSASGGLNVRASAGGIRLGSQPIGAQGTVTDGPSKATLNGVSHWFWKINFDTGVDGWAAGDYLSLVSPSFEPSFNFSLSNGGSRSVTQGSSITTVITATLSSGVATAVSFALSGLAEDAAASFSSTTCTPTCSTTLTITTPATTPAGNYTVTVTGSGGGISRTTSFTYTVREGGISEAQDKKAEHETYFELSLDALSKYIYRAYAYSERAVYQARVTAGLDSWSFNCFANYDPDIGRVNEAMFNADFTASMGAVTFSLGYLITYYDFEVDFLESLIESTQEVYMGTSLDSLPFTPSAFVYYDFDEGDGRYYELSAKKTFEWKQIEFNTLGSLIYNDHYFLESSGWSHAEAALLAAAEINPFLDLESSVRYSYPFDIGLDFGEIEFIDYGLALNMPLKDGLLVRFHINHSTPLDHEYPDETWAQVGWVWTH